MLMRPGHDWFYTYYREKSVAVTLGMPFKDIFLGLLNRDGDPNSGGVNMPEQWSSKEFKLVAQSACTGTQYLPAVGAARALRYDGSDAIVYASSGEGATSEGEFFEALNWATRESLPILFVVQNNGYAISVPQKYQTASDVYRIAAGFGLPAFHLEGTSSFDEMYELLPGLIQGIRSGKGPALIEFNVVRLDNHSSSDDQRKYRHPEELARAEARDPILGIERRVVDEGIRSESEVADLRAAIKEEVDRAAEEADSHPFPQNYDVMQHVFSDDLPVRKESEPAFVNSKVSMVQAINNGLREEMRRNPKIYMWGEDIQDPKGGVFGATKGLTEEFGEDRCMNSALAEASILGIAGGMGTLGYMPIVEIQFADYIWPAFMQMRDRADALEKRRRVGLPDGLPSGGRRLHQGRPVALGEHRRFLRERAGVVRRLPLLRPRREGALEDRGPDAGPSAVPRTQRALPRDASAHPRAGRELPHPVRQGEAASQRHGPDCGDVGLHGPSGRGRRQCVGGGGRRLDRSDRLALDRSVGQASCVRERAPHEPGARGARGHTLNGIRRRSGGRNLPALLRRP